MRDVSCPLVMTMTVDPVGVPHVVVRDVRERWQQYDEAVRFWIREPSIHQLVIVENSGYPGPYESWVDLARVHGKEVELLLYRNNLAAQRFGKGYGDGEQLKYAIQHSVILAQHRAFYKVTGRLRVINFRRVSRIARSSDTVFAKRFFGRHQWVDTRFFKVGRRFFTTHLLEAYRRTFDAPATGRPQVALGQVYWDILHGWHWPSFFPLPDIRGVSGYGERYGDDPVKHAVKSLTCLLGLYRV